MTATICRWRGLENGSHERLTLRLGHRLRAQSAVSNMGDVFVYDILLDADWCFRHLHVRHRQSGQSLSLNLQNGQWDVNGALRPDLAGAAEIDLRISPFTNSLPINRLAMPIGESAGITVAYVDFPSLAVSAQQQRYTRLAEDRYVFEAVGQNFRREISVDAQGLVVDYPGLFVRL